MLRKGNELHKKDKEILLDLDDEGSVRSYGSLQNGSSINSRSVSAAVAVSLLSQQPSEMGKSDKRGLQMLALLNMTR